MLLFGSEAAIDLLIKKLLQCPQAPANPGQEDGPLRARVRAHALVLPPCHSWRGSRAEVEVNDGCKNISD